MTTVPVKGVRVKDGKLVKVTTAKNVSQRIREKNSKRVSVKRKGTP